MNVHAPIRLRPLRAMRATLAAFIFAAFAATQAAPACAAGNTAVDRIGQSPDVADFADVALIACTLLDGRVAEHLDLTREQQAAWLSLKQEQAMLAGALPGADCMATLHPAIHPAGPAGPAEETGTWAAPRPPHRTHTHLPGFLMGLSEAQRALLDAAVLARRNAHSDIQEKLILHRLML